MGYIAADTATLEAIVQYHLIPMAVESEQLSNNQTIEPVGGQNDIRVNVSNGNVAFTSPSAPADYPPATVIEADIDVRAGAYGNFHPVLDPSVSRMGMLIIEHKG